MCIADPCDAYTPDYSERAMGGNLCTGMGWTPPCVNCGLDEYRHT